MKKEKTVISVEELLKGKSEDYQNGFGSGYINALMTVIDDMSEAIKDETMWSSETRYGLLMFVRELEDTLNNLKAKF